MKRCALYVRVSTAEQRDHGLSVDSQIEALQEYCKVNKYAIVDVYNDAGFSARKSYKKRPAMQRMINDCQAGKIDLILMTKLDRFFRSVKDYYEVMGQIGEIPWRAIWEDYETETSSGVFKVNIMLSVAQSEADRTSERIKAVNEYKRARGDYVGKAPTGYMLHGKDLIIDPDQHDAVALYFAEFRRTSSIRDAFVAAKANGLNCTRETATRMLHNPVYAGQAFGNYKCEPYLSQEEFDEIQRMSPIIERPHFVKTGRVYLFNGIIRCGECGGIYNGTVRWLQCGQAKKPYKYYRCVAHQNLICDNNRSITEAKLEKWLLSVLSDKLDEYRAECEMIPQEQKDNAEKIKSLEAKLKRIGDRYEDGDITRDEYRQKRDAIKAEIEELSKIVETKKPPAELPENWREVYDQLDDSHKRLFWRSIVKCIVISRDADPQIIF